MVFVEVFFLVREICKDKLYFFFLDGVMKGYDIRVKRIDLVMGEMEF